jgi:hypothetical protein
MGRLNRARMKSPWKVMQDHLLCQDAAGAQLPGNSEGTTHIVDEIHSQQRYHSILLAIAGLSFLQPYHPGVLMPRWSRSLWMCAVYMTE